jgi:hypothetical protein
MAALAVAAVLGFWLRAALRQRAVIDKTAAGEAR